MISENVVGKGSGAVVVSEEQPRRANDAESTSGRRSRIQENVRTMTHIASVSIS